MSKKKKVMTTIQANKYYMGVRVRAPCIDDGTKWRAGLVIAIQTRPDGFIILVIKDGSSTHKVRQNRALLL